MLDLGSPNLHQIRIMGPIQTLLKMALVDLDVYALKQSKLVENGLFCVITRHAFDLGSPNLHQMCILGPSRTLLKFVLIDFDLQGHLSAKTVQIRKNGLILTIT